MVSSEPDFGKALHDKQSEYVAFAGENVRLAGQVDYPADSNPPARGYPLLFIIQHATCTTRNGYQHIARIGTNAGFAVFRWDKRGTGDSGSGGGGSVTEDTLQAYATAINQPHIDPSRVIILAQNEGSILLEDAFQQFVSIQKPLGVLLLGNMLDEKKIVHLDVPVHIVVSKNDWNAWQIYAESAARAHAKTHNLPTGFYVAPNTNRRLMYTNGGTFHKGAETSILEWLNVICPISTSN